MTMLTRQLYPPEATLEVRRNTNYPMPTNSTPSDVEKAFAERLALLPPVVQQAIQSANLEKHLRALADSHKLHIDQWELLENEVKLALLGFEDAEKLPENLRDVVGVDAQTAAELATAINDEIFEPIREELERALTHPEAKAAAVDDIEKARQEAITLARQTGEAAPPAVQPATPPTQKPEGGVTRAPISDTYRPSISSTTRKDVHGDPYRELPTP